MNKILSGRIIAALFVSTFLLQSTARAHYVKSSCQSEYAKHLKLDNKHRRHVDMGPDAMRSSFELGSWIGRLPKKAMGKLFHLTRRTPGPIAVVPGVSMIVVPLVMTPFTTVAGFAAPIVGVPSAAAWMGYSAARIPKSYKRNVKLYRLMGDIFDYDREDRLGTELKKLVKTDAIREKHPDREALLAQIKRADELHFFCKKNEKTDEVKLMTRKEIVNSIVDGDLQKFLEAEDIDER